MALTAGAYRDIVSSTNDCADEIDIRPVALGQTGHNLESHMAAHGWLVAIDHCALDPEYRTGPDEPHRPRRGRFQCDL